MLGNVTKSTKKLYVAYTIQQDVQEEINLASNFAYVTTNSYDGIDSITNSDTEEGLFNEIKKISNDISHY